MLDSQPGAKSFFELGRRGQGEVRTWPISILPPKEGRSVTAKKGIFSRSLSQQLDRLVHLSVPQQNVKSGLVFFSASIEVATRVATSCFHSQVIPQD
jgi:hypothetical protein